MSKIYYYLADVEEIIIKQDLVLQNKKFYPSTTGIQYNTNTQYNTVCVQDGFLLSHDQVKELIRHGFASTKPFIIENVTDNNSDKRSRGTSESTI